MKRSITEKTKNREVQRRSISLYENFNRHRKKFDFLTLSEDQVTFSSFVRTFFFSSIQLWIVNFLLNRIFAFPLENVGQRKFSVYGQVGRTGRTVCFRKFVSVVVILNQRSFDEMVDHMKSVAQQPQELTVEERNLLSVAYKNVIGSRRASWRVISSIEQKGDADKLGLIQQYKKKIETELEDICSDILEIIKNELIPNSDSEEGKVFYYKMKGDYHR